MRKLFLLFLFLSVCTAGFAQVLPGRTRPFPGQPTNPNNPNEASRDNRDKGGEDNVDSLRAKLDARKDSIIYTAKYIKFTKEEFLKDSTRLFPLDTSATNFHRYRVIDDPENPTMNLGLSGLSTRDLLFTPVKTIGFDAGFHFLDRYLLKPSEITYFQARAPYTELYYVTPAFGRLTEQMFLVKHSQNVKPNWNIGASFAKMGSRSFYGAPARQADRLVVNHLNASLWSWYESKNKRYTLLANAVFNNLKTYDNGSILNDSIYTNLTNIRPEFQEARLNNAKHNWRNNSFYVKQFYNIGRQKNMVANDSTSTVLPTQRLSYQILYNKQKFLFTNGSRDNTGLLKNYYLQSNYTADSTQVNHLQNEFTYSFYVRGKSVSFLRNELKVNVGLQHDYYQYKENTFNTIYQNVTLKGVADYSFSDKASLNLNVQQLIQGRNFGDFLYQASLDTKLSNNVGRIILNVYSQNQSPALIYEQRRGNHYQWNLNFEKTKTQNFGFTYSNPKFNLSVKAEYYLITNHLYFNAGANGDAIPAQLRGNINLLKLSLRKDLKFGKFTSENYLVYQKTDFETVLRTPEVYAFHSIYFHTDFFKVLKTDIGVDIKYFGKYTAPSYAPAIGAFYNAGNVRFDTYPVIDFFVRTNWKRANLFLRYDYANQGLFSKGYYMVNRYPMPYSLAKFGVSWRFYD